MAGWSAYQNIILPETRKNRVTRALEDMQRPEPIERGGSSYGQQQYGKPVSTFWTNPTNVAQYYSLANSYDAKPDWMDDAFVDFINQAYAGFEMANQTATWQDWKPLQPDDQFNMFLQSFAAPPTGFEAPALEEQQPYPTVQDPGYLTGGLTEAQWDALPWYQQWAYKIFSSPRSAGAAIGGIAGIAGGPAGIAAGAGLGAGLGAIGEKAPWLAGIMDTLDYLAEGAERFLGASSLLMTGEVDTFADLSAAWKAGHLTYDVARLMDEQVVDLLKPAQKVDWTNDELIYEAYDRIRRGENVDDVYASIQERTGFAGEMRDLMGHMIFDPLNLTPFVFGKLAKGGLKLSLTAAKALDKTGDISRAYKPLELALDASKGVVDAAQKWGSEIRVGAVEPELLSKLDPISKWLGNVNAQGISKDIVKPPELTGFANVVNRVGGAAATGSVAAIVGAGIGGPFGALVTGGLGALYGGKKGLMYLTNLTPASRAYEVFDNTVRNITNVIHQADGDKGLTIKYIKSMANTPHQLAGELSMKSLEAPDAAAIPLAFKSLTPRLEAHLKIWDATTTPRDVLNSIAKALGKDAGDVVKMLGDAKQADVLFKQIDDAARASGNTGLVSKIEDGTFNLDALKEMTDIFVKQKAAYNNDMWYAQLYEMLGNETADWAAKWFDVQPEASMIRLSNTLKSAQSLVLLQLSPTYLINNVLNNTVTMTRDGVFGMRNMNMINNLWNRIGIKSNKLKQGVGPIGEVKGANAIADAMRKGDKIDAVKDFFQNNEVLKKIGVSGNASQYMEQWASAQAMTTGFVRAWNNLWKPGKGFDRMPTQVAQMLGDELTSYVHNAIQRGMNRAEIEEAVFGGYTRKFIDDVLPDIAKQRGGNEDIIRNTLHEVNAYDFLREALKGDPDDATVAKAFADLRQRVDDELDAKHTDFILENYERIQNQVQAEGGMGFIDIFGQMQLGHMDTELAHWRAWADTWSMLDEYGIKGAIRNNLIEAQIKAETARFARWNKRMTSDTRAIAAAFGADTDIAKGLVAQTEAWVNNWDTFFKTSQKAKRDFFKTHQKEWDTAAWNRLEVELNDLYRKHAQVETQIDNSISGYFVQMAEAQFGKPGADAALMWRQAMMANREKMRADMYAFRDSLTGQPYQQRRTAWGKFVPEHEQRVRDYYIQARQGAYDLYDAGRKQQLPQTNPILDELAASFVETDKIDQRAWVMPDGKLLDAEENHNIYRYYSAEKIEESGAVRVWRAKEGLQVEFFGTPTRNQIDAIEPYLTQRVVVDRLTPSGRQSFTFDTIDESIDYFKKLRKEVGNAPAAVGLPMGFIDSLDTMPKWQSVLEQNWESSVLPILDDIQAQMLGPNARYGSTIKSANLDPATMRELQVYLGKVYGQMADAKNMSVKWAESGRDMALLNYNRRYGFDTFLSSVIPYQFWYSHSMFNWALRAIDRPGWLASWARIRAMQQKQERMEGFPSRLAGKMQFNMPFLPSFMGDTMFADPLRQLFPHELLMQPFQRMAGEANQVDNRAVYILETWAADETYSQAELQAALESRQGDIWNKAVAQAKVEIDSEFNNPMDFMNAISGPLLPISWAYKLAQGKKDEIGELPVTRAIQAMTAWATPGGLNIEAPLRKALGMKVGGEYYDYYIESELTNMAAMGEISAEDAMTAMIDKTGAAYQTALTRVGKKQSIRYFASSFAADFFPEGEQKIRALREEFQAAIETNNVGEFFDKHPEYQARLLSFADTPEEKMRKFAVSAIWRMREELPDLRRKAIEKQLGVDFERNFLDSETRSVDSISLDKLMTWARAFGAALPEATKGYGENLKFDLPSSAEEERYGWYYDEKDRLFPGISDINERYNAFPKGSAERKAYLKMHPELIQYWNWNDGIKTQYPEIKELQKEVSNQIYPQFEIDINDISPIVKRQLTGYFYSMEPLSRGARSELARLWAREGKPTDDLDAFIEMLRSYIMP